MAAGGVVRCSVRDELAAELCALIADDDATRARLAADGSLFRGYHPEMAAVHHANAARLRAIIATHGWPGRSLVGDEAAAAAWRIVQHAIGLPAFQRAMLPVLTAAAAAGDVDPAQVAMLDDRIRVFEGRPQRYGTQYDWDEDGAALVPMVGVEAPDGVDARRAAVGLPPMVWRRAPAADEAPPPDRAARQLEAARWMREVGWR